MEYSTNHNHLPRTESTPKFPYVNERTGKPEWATYDCDEIKRLLKLAQTARPGTHDDAFMGGTSFSPHQINAFFDQLPPVELEFMVGTWRYANVPSNNRQDYLLEMIDFHGKRFYGADTNYQVDPVICWSGGKLIRVGSMPYWLFKRIPETTPSREQPVRRAILHKYNQCCVLPFSQTKEPHAHNMIVEHRGVCTTAMVYDHMPMVDVFKKVDDNTIMLLYIVPETRSGPPYNPDAGAGSFLSLTRDPNFPEVL